MNIPLFQVDSFSSEPFRGNPAGVCLLPCERGEEWMLNVAREMNLSETAFLYKLEDGFSLRWFTPKVEVSLCGHATLAAAHILWETRQIKENEEARFYTKSGLLTAAKKGDWIELNFPSRAWEEAVLPEQVKLALGIEPKYVGRNVRTYLIEVDSENAVRTLKPDFDMLKKTAVKAVIVTSLAYGNGYDFVSRFFAPGIGIEEDPVTGAAHCYLGPYWQRKLNKNEFIAYQASERGGYIKVRVEGERVFLSGNAVTVFSINLITDNRDRQNHL
jgi:PhzF family phenazine biosynthesis protein